ncbi:MAG: Hrp-dependent type III effector protein [Bradyrhizobium sp.]|uniref:four-carbon acid sugar kinase family protein n=1 Tax=Bradyrhizobium sp. TaxID=376 RepID=UPI001D1D0048|nr:four-carbon acid sugar kinase family protein [Bradyrhizobium sp.]MBV9560208.1 Hrp-dependent type III effector protein [Bradyrhizobium sp.]
MTSLRLTSLRLLADDLTGALDTTAEFVGLLGPLGVHWAAGSISTDADSFAIDSGTREAGADAAFSIVRALAPRLGGATVAFKKIDSLLRGPWVAEVEACLATGLWDACLVAPAFPHQGRLTRAGQHYARTADGSWQPVGINMLEQFRAGGLDARIADPDRPLAGGISILDAAQDADLDRTVRLGRAAGRSILWCGSGGLAGALAGRTEVGVPAALKRPVLGVFGSDQPATAAQLAVCAGILVQATTIEAERAGIRQRLDGGVALVHLQPLGAVSRAAAAAHVATEIAQLVRALEAPGTLLVAGGETLKALCLATAARGLQVTGRLEPGIPRSVLQGGVWDGVEVISKSGAFGPPDLWLRLLQHNDLM